MYLFLFVKQVFMIQYRTNNIKLKKKLTNWQSMNYIEDTI